MVAKPSRVPKIKRQPWKELGHGLALIQGAAHAAECAGDELDRPQLSGRLVAPILMNDW
jgi:hypothetical protein